MPRCLHKAARVGFHCGGLLLVFCFRSREGLPVRWDVRRQAGRNGLEIGFFYDFSRCQLGLFWGTGASEMVGLCDFGFFDCWLLRL